MSESQTGQRPKQVYQRYHYPNNVLKKLLDFDFLGAVQFKCNTCAKSVT